MAQKTVKLPKQKNVTDVKPSDQVRDAQHAPLQKPGRRYTPAVPSFRAYQP